MRRNALILMIILATVSLGSVGIVLAQGPVHVVVVNEFSNVRIAPALGAEVKGTVSAGHEFYADARSGDGEWLRVDYGGEGWVNMATLVVLSGDVNALPVADPRTIPYGGFDSPRSGTTNQTGPMNARATNGVRLRAGPSTAYPTLANIFYNQVASVTGRLADSSWLQLNYNGTLGWAASQFLELQGTTPITDLPVGGIVADQPPLSDSTSENYIATLRLMRARLDLAQPSLDQIRASWTDSALTGRAACHSYPARPSDINIATPLLAAFYPTLDPLQTDFNTAMANLRHAIDLFIEVCNQPGTGNPVGRATVQGALGVVNTVDAEFATLRAQLDALIPPERQPGPNECVLTYNGQQDILPVVQLGVITLDSFEADKFVSGYCFDAIAGQNLMVQTLQYPDSNIVHFLSISPLDNPTNFTALGRGSAGGNLLTVSPINILATGRYVLIITDIGASARNEPPRGNFAFIINVVGTGALPTLVYDTNTNTVILQNTSPQPSTTLTPDTGNVVQCPSLAFTCNQLFTCDEAKACLQAGNTSLDPDGNGIPCEQILCPG